MVCRRLRIRSGDASVWAPESTPAGSTRCGAVMVLMPFECDVRVFLEGTPRGPRPCPRQGRHLKGHYSHDNSSHLAQAADLLGISVHELESRRLSHEIPMNHSIGFRLNRYNTADGMEHLSACRRLPHDTHEFGETLIRLGARAPRRSRYQPRHQSRQARCRAVMAMKSRDRVRQGRRGELDGTASGDARPNHRE